MKVILKIFLNILKEMMKMSDVKSMLLNREALSDSDMNRLIREVNNGRARLEEINKFRKSVFYSKHISPLNEKEKELLGAFAYYENYFFIIDREFLEVIEGGHEFIKDGVYLLDDELEPGFICAIFLDEGRVFKLRAKGIMGILASLLEVDAYKFESLWEFSGIDISKYKDEE